jgi:DNA-binding response OmpR family regulator
LLVAKPTIYLFEDDDGLRNLLIELLHDELQAHVDVVQSMPELLRLCEAEPPDLVVADFWGTSHLTLSDEERAQIVALGATAPTVLVSARQWAQEAAPSDLGLAAMVTKPIDIDVFARVLRHTLSVLVLPLLL